MTIGELFIKLGFKIDGDKDLVGVERSMSRATGSATKLALEVAALNAAFLYMIETSLKAAVALRSFNLTTGLSIGQLQIWEHAAQVNGLAAGTLTDAIKNLQTARTNFALGNPQAVGAWTLLGVDPRQDPFKVLEALRQRLINVKDVGVARNLLGQVGLESMLPLLRSTNLEWEKWSRNFIISTEQVNKLAALNAAWQSLKLSVTSLATQFSALFTPALGALARAIQIVAAAGAGFVRWLQGSGPLARFLRIAMQLLAIDVLFLGVALTGLVAVLGTVAAVVSFLGTAVGILTIAWAPWLLLIGAAVVALGGMILLLQDLWVNVRGGKSAFDWLHSSIPEVWALAHGLENILKVWKELKSLGHWGEGLALAGGLDVMRMLPSGLGGTSNSRTEINNDIKINESVSPRATSKELLRELQQLHRGALNQAPVRNY